MTIAQIIEEYVTVKRATGLRFRSAATILRTFARVAGVIEINDVTQETVRAFLKGSGPITSGWHQKHYTLAGLFRFAMQRGLVSASPVAYRLPKRPAYATPYIYSEEELRRMLDATSALDRPHPKNGQPATIPALTFRTLILLLYGAGLRLGEALALTLDDVDLHTNMLLAEGSWLRIRPIDRLESTQVERSEGASSPFFSPDGRWIGFFAKGRLFKVSTSGGAPTVLCEAGSECRGASWSTRDAIVFTPTPASNLSVVPADGGAPRPATTLDFAQGERTHRWPDVLPNGLNVLFTIARAGSGSFDEGEIAVASLVTGERRLLLMHASCARYVPTGHLVYMRGGSIMAVPFVGGAAEMQWHAFALCNFVGASAWVGLCLGAGLVFGNVPIVKQNFSLVTIGIVVVSLLPVVVSAFRRTLPETQSG